MRKSGTSSKCKDRKTEKQDHKAMKPGSRTGVRGASQAAGREKIRNAAGTDDVSTRAKVFAQPRWLMFMLAEAADE